MRCFECAGQGSFTIGRLVPTISDPPADAVVSETPEKMFPIPPKIAGTDRHLCPVCRGSGDSDAPNVEDSAN